MDPRGVKRVARSDLAAVLVKARRREEGVPLSFGGSPRSLPDDVAVVPGHEELVVARGPVLVRVTAHQDRVGLPRLCEVDHPDVVGHRPPLEGLRHEEVEAIRHNFNLTNVTGTVPGVFSNALAFTSSGANTEVAY